MRTTQEIVEFYRKQASGDFFGTFADDLLRHITFADAKEFLKPNADEAKWHYEPLADDATLNRIAEYMTFAWTKVRNHRGISAGRSLAHMRAWLWLLGDNELVTFCDDGDNYAQYGAPVLAAICRKYGFPIPKGSDVENMIAGRPCEAGCDQGCG